MKACVLLFIWLAVFGSACAQISDEATRHLRRAESLRDAGEWDAALPEYREAVALAPNDYETHFSFAIALERARLFDQAVREYDLSFRLNPSVFGQDCLNDAIAAQHYFHAVELQRRGEWKAAIAEYQLSIDADPRDAVARFPDLATEHCSLAIALQTQGNLAKAQEHLRQAYVLHSEHSQTDPCKKLWEPLSTDPTTQIARADKLMWQLEQDEAMEMYRAVLAMNLSARDAAHVHMQMAEGLRSSGNAEGAVASAREAARLQPDAATYRELATVLVWDGKIAEAMTAYRNAVQLNPKDAQLHYDFGKMLIDHFELDEGMKELRETLQLYPRAADLASLAHEGIAVALKAEGKKESAISELNAGLALKPSDDTASSAHCLMAEILNGEGKTADARREAETADNLDPHDAEGGRGCVADLSGPQP